ncbi:hypothetical protein B0H17DRAFT_1145755 [Mycena rosella]|uniref:Uncharacterized protein n=1 Tax=Mycena rosella TaxID=1033263 RepID=A0AAD7CQ75_MYCRO|nr:hypothetical protein B0H17DRAFT_1145755 [Mycena rosella]
MSGPTATVSGGRQFVQSPVTCQRCAGHAAERQVANQLSPEQDGVRPEKSSTFHVVLATLGRSATKLDSSWIHLGTKRSGLSQTRRRHSRASPTPPWMHPRHRCPMRAVGIANIDGRVGLTWIHMGTKCRVTWITKLGAEPLEALRAPSHVSGPSPPEARRRRRCQR